MRHDAQAIRDSIHRFRERLTRFRWSRMVGMIVVILMNQFLRQIVWDLIFPAKPGWPNPEYIQEKRKVFKDRFTSHAACEGNSSANRTCHFKNLYYNVHTNEFVLNITSESKLIEVPELEGPGQHLLDLSNVVDHNIFHFRISPYNEPDPIIRLSGLTDLGPVGTRVQGVSIMTARFYPYNIMHVLHDDALGIYALKKTWKRLWKTKDPTIVFVDPYGERTDFDYIYRLFGTKTVTLNSIKEAHLRDNSDSKYIVFEDVYVGNSKRLSWYQYGYGVPQGPLSNWDKIEKSEMEEALQHIYDQGVAKSLGTPNLFKSTERVIVIVSRTRDRLITNEKELATALSLKYEMTVHFLRHEEHPAILPFAASLLKRARILVGMHGAMLALSGFLPSDAVFVEMFPYGVPPENYTPFRTLAIILGIRYAAWVNTDAKRNFESKSNSPDRGSISHYPVEVQGLIRTTLEVPKHACCDNSFWLFRIFQDTEVNVHELIELIDQMY